MERIFPYIWEHAYDYMETSLNACLSFRVTALARMDFRILGRSNMAAQNNFHNLDDYFSVLRDDFTLIVNISLKMTLTSTNLRSF